MWQKSRVPYVSHPNKLQHVDVWVPAKYAPHPDRPPASWLPDAPHTLWVVYIHGGAWRDPLITSESLAPTLKSLPPAWLASMKTPVAFASVGYTLSPYPDHPSQPSVPSDRSRNAAHPAHILDVLEAISFLQRRAGFGDNYILAGHSCGATLAFQAAMDPARWAVDGAGGDDVVVKAPSMVLGLNGLYDLPGLTEDPGGGHERHRRVYAGLTSNAFGHDKNLWRAVSPALVVESWATEWPGGRHVMLVQSPGDALVPYRQGERMRDGLVASKTDKLAVELIEGDGDHDEIWEQGTLMAEVLVRAIRKASGLS
ncbi:hypothetical protein EsDP_00004102 [Epichloe bromicola]|uniref:Kynurenine formamidase n=1 Tax=Epichloe bromicola TaxID=79588 RepID=A0ABQ0CQQ3_9HYPO